MPTRSNISYPQSRHAPKEVIQRLREIDPAAELIYFGGGRWVLGVYRPNNVRADAARRRLAFLSRHAAAPRDLVQDARLAATGLRPIQWYAVQGEPDARIVEDFRVRDYNWRNHAEATFRARLRESDSDEAAAAKTERVRRTVHAAAGDVWRHAFKNPVTVRV